MLTGLFAFVQFFGLAIVLTFVFQGVYMLITPHKEVELIKANNAAAAVVYVGALAGFVIPLASALANAVSLLDFALWGLVAGVVQIGAFLVFRLFYPRISTHIEAGEMAVALKLAGWSVAVGLLNGASMTY
ncbi:MAG: membrane protein [Rhodospirillaceae bacterium BRH_c57]|nr:MAG: membrane protein [Rhodospirillaceae bacterium BRH_c57]